MGTREEGIDLRTVCIRALGVILGRALPEQCDAVIHLDETCALESLSAFSLGCSRTPETYPSAL